MVLTPAVLGSVRDEIRHQLEQEFASSTDTDTDTRELAGELRQLRAEQKRLATAIAMVDDAPELLSELNKRRDRIRYLETELAAARRTPGDTAELVARVEAGAREKLHRLHQVMLDDREGLRELFLSLFPQGLLFKPAKLLKRRVWAISGSADLGVQFKWRPQRDSNLPQRSKKPAVGTRHPIGITEEFKSHPRRLGHRDRADFRPISGTETTRERAPEKAHQSITPSPARKAGDMVPTNRAYYLMDLACTPMLER
jgi:hypothetical protein